MPCLICAAVRKKQDKITLLVEMMLVGNEDMPCFSGSCFNGIFLDSAPSHGCSLHISFTVARAGGASEAMAALNERLNPSCSSKEFVNGLIDSSLNNWTTRWYDRFQRWTLGIA
jgi:phosphatidylinositol 4-kinase